MNEAAPGHRWLALALLVVAQFMIVLDVSIMNVALPSIERTFRLAVSDLQWIVTAYTLSFGGFLLLGGRAADLFGRRKIFLIGLSGFTLVSLFIGIANSESLLIPLRALQGFCAAFMSPAALSLVLSIFHDPSERTRALSMWGAVSAAGAAAGLLLGGLLTQYLSWRWNFFVNVPVGALVIYGALMLLPAHADEDKSKKLDIFGALLATAGLMVLVYGLSQAHAWGWDSAKTLGSFGFCILALIAFVWNELKVSNPLVPFSIFRVGNVAAADLVQLPITGAMFAMFFFLSLYVQNILQYSPLKAGLAFLPVTATIGLTASLAPRLIEKVGYKWLLVFAPLLLAAGLSIFTYLPTHGGYVEDILPGILIMAVGLGLTFVSITMAATSGVPPRESGLASGLLSTAQQIGGSLGLAILSSAAATKTTSLLASGSNPLDATVQGFHSAFLVGVSFAIFASIAAFLFIRTVPSVRVREMDISALPH